MMCRRIRHLAPRLILLLTVALILVEGTVGILNVDIAEQERIEQVITSADQLSRSIISATWHSMLADRRRDAYNVMGTIAEEHAVKTIRLYNRDGQVVFRTDSDADETEFTRWEEVARGERTLIGQGQSGRRHLRMQTAIPNEPACYTAACHAHGRGEEVLGVLDVTTDLTEVDAEMGRLAWRAAWTSLTHIAVFGTIIFVFVRHFVGKPIRKLIRGTQAVSEQDFDRPIEVDSSTELGELARSFNRMIERLSQAQAELDRFTRELEAKVEQRSRDLEMAREKLIRSDRLASLGQLAASVAHEVNNPIGGVLNLAMLMRRILQPDGIPAGRAAEFRDYLEQVTSETERVGRIVSDLLAFARGTTPRSGDANLNRILHATLALAAHKLELGSIELRLELEPGLPTIRGDRSQLEQVMLNLVMNAAEAMHEGGRITIRTRSDRKAGEVQLEIEDQGSGIPTEILPRIFDPFFTTKEEGKGVGLGLSVVYGIIESHHGRIGVCNLPERGVLVVVRLPWTAPGEVASQARSNGEEPA